MWFCFNDGFISAVESGTPGELKVRARRKKHLEAIFPGKDILVTKNTDYKYRVFCTKEELSKIVQDRIMNLNYGNFKASVDDDDLHDLYGRFWWEHYKYQR